MQFDHPVFGRMTIDKFQRGDLTSESKIIIWKGFTLQIREIKISDQVIYVIVEDPRESKSANNIG